MSDNGSQAGPGKHELVKASCGHYVPRPAGWGNGLGTVITTQLGLQAKLDDAARALGTPFYQREEMPGIGELRIAIGDARRGLSAGETSTA